MKKNLFSLLVMMAPMLGFTQGNGGITNENASTKIEWIGHSLNGQYIVKVTNKQNCSVPMRVQWGGTNRFREKIMSSGASDTFHITTPPTPTCFLGAKPTSFCSNTMEMGTVELNVCQVIPVKFSSIAGQRVGPRSVRLIFIVEEITNIKQFNIQYSLDNGKTFKTANIKTPDGIIVGKPESVIVNY
jgi:hypothetical protein